MGRLHFDDRGEPIGYGKMTQSRDVDPSMFEALTWIDDSPRVPSAAADPQQAEEMKEERIVVAKRRRSRPRPAFHAYGRRNVSPVNGGFYYGDYLVSHNVKAQRRTYREVYESALKRIGKPVPPSREMIPIAVDSTTTTLALEDDQLPPLLPPSSVQSESPKALPAAAKSDDDKMLEVEFPVHEKEEVPPAPIPTPPQLPPAAGIRYRRSESVAEILAAN